MIRTISYGGGVQSTAMLVLAVQGRIDFQTALFCNVGDRAEAPETLAYVEQVAAPYCEANGIELVQLRRRWVRGERAGQAEDLWDRLTREGSRSLPIPVRMSNGAPGTRSCTIDFKIQVMAKWHKQHGATKETPAHVAIGFSTDEIERTERAHSRDYEVVEYPLLDLRIDRSACAEIIRKAGLPVPSKSSCFFCPFHSPRHWAEMRRDRPEQFWKAVELEQRLNERTTRGKDPVWLTRFNKPLDEAIAEAQPALFSDEPEGFCLSGTCGR